MRRRNPGRYRVCQVNRQARGEGYKMKRFWLLVFLAVLLPAGAFATVDVADGIKKVEPEIKAYVKKRAAREGGAPYISALVRGDINCDAN